MSKQIIGIHGFGSVVIERTVTGGFDGFHERTYYDIKAVTPRLESLVSRIQDSTYHLGRAAEIRERIEERVREVVGDDCMCFKWGW